MNQRLDALIEKYSKAKEYVEVDGNFTICELKIGKTRAIGISKRNCESDTYDPHRGVEIAYFRALKKLDVAMKHAPKKPVKKAKKS